MATLNLGRIKPVFQGAYNGSTAYVVDDIVTFGDETFICIQASTGNATSNASYWTKLAAKGTDGTDVGTTLTTQCDILYRDGSGLQRLGAGTAGQVLKTGGAGANPSWGTLSSDYVLLSDTSVSNAAHIQVDVFSSTYKVYKVFIGGAYATSNGYGTELRMNTSAGTVQTGSNYCGVNDGAYYNSSSSTGQQNNGTFNDNKWKISNMSNNSDETSDHEFTFINPYDASQNTSFIGTGGGFEGNHAYVRHNHGVYKGTEQHTGFTFYVTTGNIYAPVVKVYGLK